MVDLKPHSEKLEHEGVSWIDVANPSASTFTDLQEKYQLDPIHLSESLQNVQHTEVDREEHYIFLVLRMPVFEPSSGKIGTYQTGVFLSKDFLITIHNDHNYLIAELMEQYRDPRAALADFKRGSAYLLYRLISRLLKEISGMTESVIEELDAIEGIVFDDKFSDAHRIGQMRQHIIRLRSIIGPKRLVLEDLADQIGSFSGRGIMKYYDNNTKTANRLWETVEEAKDTVEIYKDAVFTTNTEQTNATLAVLTLIFTFTIPITVLGTVFGMNILLPGSVNGRPWHFWGSYTTLILAVIVSLFTALIMYVYFKKKRWI